MRPASDDSRRFHIGVAERSEENGSIGGVVSGSRCIGDARRLEIEVGSQYHIEIDVPAAAELPKKSQVAIRPEHWRIYPR
jgi:hypothetical protein